MNTTINTIVAAVLVCSGIGVFAARFWFNDNVPSVDFEKCRTHTGIEKNELYILKTEHVTSLSVAQQKFMCCIGESLISNQELQLSNIEKMISDRKWNVSADEIPTMISSCEVNGTSAKQLDLCGKIAPFLLCVYDKLEEKSADNSHKKHVETCAKKANYKLDGAQHLRDGPAITSFSSEEKNFTCCMGEKWITDGKLNVENVKAFINAHNLGGPNVNLPSIINSCESNEVNSNNLDTCDKIAPFVRCLYITLRKSG
ncbi:uncharacterized protein LOC129572942 [Sitodiplosis mosellana]|uniref:uncharacterized protein LOC129572942 n=1 Tax=Sitodiplosis mosellana TaxID=263140 RepID=UPI0024452DBE|nr:uncharacterized protein LOC129572942 [Sitodiplosis mosellana]